MRLAASGHNPSRHDEKFAAAARIAVLMRCPTGALRERFELWLNDVRALLPVESCLARLYPVAGDICRDRLGLDDASGVRQETDVVIHAAADTNFAAPHERQWDVNVEGTRRMIKWSADCPRLRRFLLVSSVFVSGSRTGRIDETASDERPGFVTYYQQTKWEAERVALASGLPVGVARISMILGSHASGHVHRIGAVHSLIKWFARGLVPLVPGDPESTGDVIATEMAAQCLARAVMAERGGWGEAHPPVWHIAAARHAPRMTELMDFVYEHFFNRPAWRRRNIPRPRMVDQAAFDRHIESVAASGHALVAHALRTINGFLPDLCYAKTYQTTRAEALWGGPLPQYDWRETMERVIRFCCPSDK